MRESEIRFNVRRTSTRSALHLGLQPFITLSLQKHVNTFSLYVAIFFYSLFGIALDFHYLCKSKLFTILY